MFEVKYPVDIKILTNFNTNTTLILLSVNVKIKKLPVTYYYREHLRHHMNLLYITAGETSHYALLKDLSRLISTQK